MVYKPSKRQSITEVSKVAGVSIATVSRVLNGHPHVADSTVNAVQAAIKSLGYEPRSSVGRYRGMNGRNTGSIAVLFTDMTQEALRTPLSGRLLHGIAEVLRGRGLSMVVSGISADHTVPACIDQRKVDGAIIRGSRMTVELAKILKLIPCVWMLEAGYQVEFDVDMITEDNPTIGTMAAHWLVKRGHKHVAILDPMPDHPSLRVRRLFFKDAAEQMQTKISEYTTVNDDFVTQVDRMVSEAERPTGLFIPGSDRNVVDAFRLLKSRGLELGRDFDLISCNNDPNLLSALDPRLPNIDIRPELIGRSAVEMMLWRLQNPGDERRRSLLSPLLVEGVGLGEFSSPPGAKSGKTKAAVSPQ
jgi:DNA-binding LacI/PurR family transcriptional regulator